MSDTSIPFVHLSHGSYFKATHPDTLMKTFVKRGDYDDEAYPIHGETGLAISDGPSFEFAPDEIVTYLDQGSWPDCTEAYIEEIRAWDWDAIHHAMKHNILFDKYEDDQPRYSTWIGTTIGVMPSGKVYAPWTTNQTDEDCNRDECFNDALDVVCQEQGVYPYWVDGDLHIGKAADWKEIAVNAGYEMHNAVEEGTYWWREGADIENEGEPFDDEDEAWKDCCLVNKLVEAH